MAKDVRQRSTRRGSGTDITGLLGRGKPQTNSPHKTPLHRTLSYYRAGESRWYYWNIFDQVLLRPSLLPWFNNKDLQIVTGDGVTRLINSDGLPERELLSDHLSILFRLNV